MNNNTRRFIRIGAVAEKTGKSRSSIYRDLAKGNFPKSVQTGEATVAWLESDIDQWIDDRVAASREVKVSTNRIPILKTPESLFQEASHDSKHMPKPDMKRVDELHSQLAPIVDKFNPTDEELLSVLATFIWTMPYAKKT